MKQFFQKNHVYLQVNFLNLMKKRIYLILLSLTVIFFSCQEEKSKFEEQLFTIAEMKTAIRQCITAASDSTLNALCVVDTLTHKHGYYYYSDSTYRIALPKQMKDTLKKHGFEEDINSLIVDMNRAAEQCGNSIKRAFLTPLDTMLTFSNPYALIHNTNSAAITAYVKENKQMNFFTVLSSSILLEQFKNLNVHAKWNRLQEAYRDITGEQHTIDIVNYAALQMMNGFFKEMGLAEKAIRENSSLRGNKNSMLYRVFATLDE